MESDSIPCRRRDRSFVVEYNPAPLFFLKKKDHLLIFVHILNLEHNTYGLLSPNSSLHMFSIGGMTPEVSLLGRSPVFFIPRGCMISLSSTSSNVLPVTSSITYPSSVNETLE